jgi:hypothetical protein
MIQQCLIHKKYIHYSIACMKWKNELWENRNIGKDTFDKESIGLIEENTGPSICCLGTFSLMWSYSCRLCGETVRVSR